MRRLILVLAVLLFALPGCTNTIVLTAEQEEKLPLLDGGFWQVGPGLSQQFTDEQLAAEVADFKAAGLDVIMIQYTTAPEYDRKAETYYAYVPNDVLPMHPGLAGKDPVTAIMDAAEKEGVKVILGGLLMPLPRWENYEENIAIWTSEAAMNYRRAVIEKYKDYECFYGYYTPNEPNPMRLYENGCDPQLMIDATTKVTEFVHGLKPDLLMTKSIGLYLEPTESGLQHASMEYLDTFWRPWVSQLDLIDVWMVIDGVGTHLSTLEHTDRAQVWAKELAAEYGKQFWVDVECAHMGAASYPMTIEELKASLAVAAKHGDTLVTFDYAHYMSKGSPKPEARQLYEDYINYRQELLNPTTP